MPLYLLRPIEPDGTEPFCWRDTAQGFVVRARNAREARVVVAQADVMTGPGTEGSEVWMQETRTSCELLEPYGGARLVLRDFHYGPI